MRHASLESTMKFYVEIEAKSTIEEVRRHLKKYQQVPEKVTEEFSTGKNESETLLFPAVSDNL